VASALMSVADKGANRAGVTLLGDAHPLFRSGMRYLLQDKLASVDIAEAGSRSEVLAALERRPVDLVLSSLFTSEGEWDDYLGELLQRAPAGRLIILSSVDDPILICRVLAAGAAGFVFKETAPEIILYAIRLVIAGGVYVPPAALSVLSRSTVPETPPKPPAGAPLSDRQQAVLNLIVQGASNKMIARSLDLSAGTVKAHVASLLRRYGAANRTELVHTVTRTVDVRVPETRGPSAPVDVTRSVRHGSARPG
jgi:DNA-binding NarL/FixJ family response regulator